MNLTALITNFFSFCKKCFAKIWFLWIICTILNIITFLFIFFKINPGTQNLALHYNVLVGVEWYGKGQNLYFIPGIGLVISLVNFILYRSLKDNRFYLSELTAYVSLFIQIILLIAAMFLARVN